MWITEDMIKDYKLLLKGTNLTKREAADRITCCGLYSVRSFDELDPGLFEWMDEEEIEGIKRMFETKKELPDWIIIEDEGQTYFFMDDQDGGGDGDWRDSKELIRLADESEGEEEEEE